MALFATCSVCGKKKLAILVNTAGICSACESQMLEQKRREEERKEAVERERAQAYYDELVRLWGKAGDLYSSEGDSIHEANEKLSACDEFINRVDGIPAITYFKDVFAARCPKVDASSCYNEDFGQLNTSPADDGTVCLNFEQLIDRIQARKERIAECLAKTAYFHETRHGIPMCSIIRSEHTDEVPLEQKKELSFFETKNITKASAKNLAAFFAVDVETTGLSPIANEIIQLSAVKFVDFVPVEAFSTYVKPRYGLKAKAQEINGITEADIAGAPYIEEIADCFSKYINGGAMYPRPAIIGHNVKFDVGFLVANNCLSTPHARDYYDTLELARKACGYYPSYKLDYLTRERLRILQAGAHDSLSDALSAGLLFKELCEAKLGSDFYSLPMTPQSSSDKPATEDKAGTAAAYLSAVQEICQDEDLQVFLRTLPAEDGFVILSKSDVAWFYVKTSGRLKYMLVPLSRNDAENIAVGTEAVITDACKSELPASHCRIKVTETDDIFCARPIIAECIKRLLSSST